MITDLESITMMPAPPRELDARVLHDGTRIRLLWMPGADGGEIILEACEPGELVPLQVTVRSADALDAFTHPWVHLPPRPAGARYDEAEAA